jgi:PAS domain S-box-containing protein
MSSAEALAGVVPSSSYESLLAADQTVLDAIPSAVYVCSADGEVVRHNRRAAELWGRTPRPGDTHERFCGSFRLYRMDGQPLPRALTPMESALRTEEAQRNQEIRIERPDGSRIVALVNIEVLKDRAGRLEGAIASFDEIVEGKQESEDRRAGTDAHGVFRGPIPAILGQQQYSDLLDALPAAIYTTDAQGRITYFNQAAVAFWGVRPELGKDEWCGSWKLYWPDGTPLPHDQCPMAVALRERKPIRGKRAIAERPDGTRVSFAPYPTPIFDSSGTLVGAVNMLVDTQVEQALATRMAEQAALFDFTDALYRAESNTDVYESAVTAILRALRCDRASILMFDDSNGMRFVAWRGLSDGYRDAVEGHSPWSADELDPTPISVEDVATAELPEALREVVRAEGIRALSFIPVMAGGRLAGKFMTYYDAPHVFTAAELDLALIVARQLGFSVERRRADEARKLADSQRDFLVQELSHRVKNTLATVISIQNQSFAKAASPEDARHSFGARIRALAQTHGHLAEGNWTGVRLDTMLVEELAPYRHDAGDNVRMSGPPVMLNAKSALTLGMAIHELATNAAKYGALSSRAGNVSAVWETDVPRNQLRIRWRETGGPAVVAPERVGFGRLLLERVLTADLGGTVRLQFAPEGLKCDVTIPLAENVAGNT